MDMKFDRPFHYFTRFLIKTVNPTPTLTLPLKGREITTLLHLRAAQALAPRARGRSGAAVQSRHNEV
jgi:hypothetical protein